MKSGRLHVFFFFFDATWLSAELWAPRYTGFHRYLWLLGVASWIKDMKLCRCRTIVSDSVWSLHLKIVFGFSPL